MEVMTASQLLDAEPGAPLVDELAALFQHGQLPRGRTIGCGNATGQLASSRSAQGWWLAWALSRQMMVEGAWAVAVDAPHIGIEAAAHLGVPIERVVRVETGGHDPTGWADAVVAAADGFDIVITQPPPHADRLWRKVQTRIQARRIVVLTVGAVPAATDFDIDLSAPRWAGIDRGHGYLAARQVTIRLGGRRMPRSHTVDLWLPNPAGTLEITTNSTPTNSTTTNSITGSIDPLERDGQRHAEHDTAGRLAHHVSSDTPRDDRVAVLHHVG